MKTIGYLSSLYGMKYITMDDDIFENVKHLYWYAAKNGNTFYARSEKMINGKRYRTLLHHLVLGKPPSGLVVDHIDRNGLNNQRSNLRLVTRRENLDNSNKRGNTARKDPNIYWHSKNRNWYIKKTIKGRQYNFGSFQTLLEARQFLFQYPTDSAKLTLKIQKPFDSLQ